MLAESCRYLSYTGRAPLCYEKESLCACLAPLFRKSRQLRAEDVGSERMNYIQRQVWLTRVDQHVIPLSRIRQEGGQASRCSRRLRPFLPKRGRNGDLLVCITISACAFTSAFGKLAISCPIRPGRRDVVRRCRCARSLLPVTITRRQSILMAPLVERAGI